MRSLLLQGRRGKWQYRPAAFALGEGGGSAMNINEEAIPSSTTTDLPLSIPNEQRMTFARERIQGDPGGRAPWL